MSDATIDDWTRLCALIDDDPELAPGVREAIDDDPWGALIDGLDECGALAYLDWKDGGMQLADALPQLPRVFRTGADLDEVGDVDALEAAIVRADEFLAPHGLRIIRLEEDSDAHPLVVVPTANVAEIVELAAKLGHEARTFS